MAACFFRIVFHESDKPLNPLISGHPSSVLKNIGDSRIRDELLELIVSLAEEPYPLNSEPLYEKKENDFFILHYPSTSTSLVQIVYKVDRENQIIRIYGIHICNILEVFKKK